MATTAQRLIVNVETGSLLPSFDGVVGVTQPRYILGDTTPVEIYLVKSGGSVGGNTAVPFAPGSTVRLALGVINQQPVGGSWELTFDGDTASGLAYNITPAALQTALNALASITAAGGVTVSKVGAQYQITFNDDGSRVPFVADKGTLFPASQIGVVTLQEGDASNKEVVLINLAVSPIALTDSFTNTVAPSATSTPNSYRLEGSIRGGGYKLNITFNQGDDTISVQTNTIPVSASLGEIAQFIYDALVNANWGTVAGNETTNSWGLRVTALDTYRWRVEFTAPEFTSPIYVTPPVITGVDVSGVSKLDGKVGELSVATAEAVAYLGTDESKRAVLEIEVETAEGVQTLAQVSCEIAGQVIASGALAPLSGDTPLGEDVANNRFVRRDAVQSLDPGTVNVIWENITTASSPSGVDLVSALIGAAAPSSSNVFATIADVGNPFDQSLNTTDSPTFFDIISESVRTAVVKLGGVGDGEISSGAYTAKESGDVTTYSATGITFADATEQTSAPVYSAGTVVASGLTTSICDADYPDEITIVIGGVTYAMPARIV